MLWANSLKAVWTFPAKNHAAGCQYTAHRALVFTILAGLREEKYFSTEHSLCVWYSFCILLYYFEPLLPAGHENSMYCTKFNLEKWDESAELKGDGTPLSPRTTMEISYINF